MPLSLPSWLPRPSMSPSRPEPILGYRWWWTFRERDGRPGLRAWVWDIPWRVPGITEAAHWDEKGERFLGGVTHMLPIPADKCLCGLYAWCRLPDALKGIQQFNRCAGDASGLLAIAGAVVTGGSTIIHGDEGLRAQYARPVAFAQSEPGTEGNQLLGAQALFADLAAAFGVPLMPLGKLETYAREFGITIQEAA